MGMLVLTRKPGQRILIGGGFEAGGVTVMVTEVSGDQVRLGINAPADIEILREEVASEQNAG